MVTFVLCRRNPSSLVSFCVGNSRKNPSVCDKAGDRSTRIVRTRRIHETKLFFSRWRSRCFAFFPHSAQQGTKRIISLGSERTSKSPSSASLRQGAVFVSRRKTSSHFETTPGLQKDFDQAMKLLGGEVMFQPSQFYREDILSSPLVRLLLLSLLEAHSFWKISCQTPSFNVPTVCRYSTGE